MRKERIDGNHDLRTVIPQAKKSETLGTHWAWAEPSVWTQHRMLTALEQGVKGGVWLQKRWPNSFFAERRGCSV